MELAEADRQIQLLEQRYIELAHMTRALRDQLCAADPPEPDGAGSLRAQLRALEGEMQSILQQVDTVEDSVLE